MLLGAVELAWFAAAMLIPFKPGSDGAAWGSGTSMVCPLDARDVLAAWCLA